MIYRLQFQLWKSFEFGSGLGFERKFLQNLAFLMLEAALFLRKCGLSLVIVLIILTFAFHFMLVSDQNPVPNSVPEPECI
jgi:hypothetical protein